MFDLAIIGGGPAGSAAAVYAARKLLKTVIIAETFGGQSIDSADVQNWIGTVAISGPDLAKNLESHVKAYAGETVTIEKGARVQKVEKVEQGFRVTTDKGKTFDAKTVLVATGGVRRKLDVPGALEFDNRGLTYCASCDGPLFSGMDVAVVGGGNAGFETAAQLLAYAKSVTLIHRGERFSADPSTVEMVTKHPNMKALTNAMPTEITGEKFVTGIVYEDKISKEKKTLPVQEVFVEIGMLPSTSFVEGLVELDSIKRVVVNPKDQRTSVSGIWAAGDCTNGPYHQNNIAAGDAVKALEDIYVYLKTK